MKRFDEVVFFVIAIGCVVWVSFMMFFSSNKGQEVKEQAVKADYYKEAKEEFEGRRTELRDNSAYILLFAQPNAAAAIVVPIGGKDSRSGKELFVNLSDSCQPPDADSKRVLVTRASNDGIGAQMVCEWYESTTAAMGDKAPFVWP